MEIGAGITNKQTAYSSELAKKFVGRTQLLSKLSTVLEDIRHVNDKNIVLVTGPSGLGKTMLMVWSFFSKMIFL